MSPSVPRIAVGQIYLWLLLALSVSASQAQEGFPALDLTINGIYGTSAHDGSVYCLVGAGACLVPQDKGIADIFIDIQDRAFSNDERVRSGSRLSRSGRWGHGHPRCSSLI